MSSRINSSDCSGVVGLNHFGFTLDGAAEKLRVHDRLDGCGIARQPPGQHRPYSEEKATDLEGNRLELKVAQAAS